MILPEIDANGAFPSFASNALLHFEHLIIGNSSLRALMSDYTDCIGDVFFCLDSAAQSRVANQICQRATEIAGHRLNNPVAFGMHSRGIERVVRSVDPQKTSCLLERLRTHAWDLHQLGPRTKGHRSHCGMQ
jgi:hypothetical protein